MRLLIKSHGAGGSCTCTDCSTDTCDVVAVKVEVIDSHDFLLNEFRHPHTHLVCNVLNDLFALLV